MSELTEYEKEAKKQYRAYKSRANLKNIEFNIDFYTFLARCYRNCYICGSPPVKILNGVDRVDNNKGYTPLNTAPCCWNCNRAKNSLSLKEYKTWFSKFGKLPDTFDNSELLTTLESKYLSANKPDQPNRRSDLALAMFDAMLLGK